ncbi:MAG: PQQ-dependent sugar dehydrogenase, partial [Gaiellaceae bacterium]
GNSRIVQYRSASGVGVRSSAKILLTVQQPYSNHKGGQLQFDTRGYLYIGFGDGGSERDPNQTSQNPKLRLGKLLRSATTTPNGRWKMVGLGLRNPWRFSFDAHDNLWIGDVGQDHREEIDFRPAARLDQLANYGWSRYEGKAVYEASHRYTNVGQKVFPVLVYRTRSAAARSRAAMSSPASTTTATTAAARSGASVPPRTGEWVAPGVSAACPRSPRSGSTVPDTSMPSRSAGRSTGSADECSPG